MKCLEYKILKRILFFKVNTRSFAAFYHIIFMTICLSVCSFMCLPVSRITQILLVET